MKGRQNEIALRIEQHQEGEGDYRTTLESGGGWKMRSRKYNNICNIKYVITGWGTWI